MTRRLGALELIEANVDPGSWHSWDGPIAPADRDPEYEKALLQARERAGTDEAVLTGRARIEGHDVALIVSEFRFLGGSIGRDAAERIVTAVRRATGERLPLIAAPSSGGTRMQEGTPAFVTMVDISRAVVEHKAAGLPYLVYLRHPTTGGVFASWGSLGHVTVAEPGALIGFLGPSVYEALNGHPFPDGVQVAENLVAKGVIDAVVTSDRLAVVAANALALLARPAKVSQAWVPDTAVVTLPRDPWDSIQLSRHPDRPGVRELLRYGAGDVVALSGTGAGEPGQGMLCALASFQEVACVVIGQDRRAQASGGPLGPDDLRAARRGIHVAQQLGRPLVCVVDTPGAELSAEAEERALAGEIARCLADLVQLTVPSVSVLLGEGCGGGALALLPGRTRIAAEHAWLSPLPPEGASVILHGHTRLAADMARRQRVGSHELLTDGVVHAVVPEPVPAHENPEDFCRRVSAAIGSQLLQQLPTH
ncbi:carboxyl transferase domain-containing protein [Acrocarpospora macrocephala]|uniref:Acetyl-CoA carboxylase n=1 Tax=Acrocarpospora macrocephala TaxID=150177 RepID=A0A5M3WF68_9ACTN|nr:carboxyl transferase domain-containing protein [Acrocarpospora macrocephala]GES06722.1 acetyl-CoA carboxylase [Acrocarpospora macrocephala]